MIALSRGELWKTAPISRTCEVLVARNRLCGLPTSHAYPVQGGGWMALCLTHAARHLDSAETIEALIESGETLE